jgi:hypothetical protein
MPTAARSATALRGGVVVAVLVLAGVALGVRGLAVFPRSTPAPSPEPPPLRYQPRKPLATSGYSLVSGRLTWGPDATLAEIAERWRGAGRRGVEEVDRALAQAPPAGDAVRLRLVKAMLDNYDGEPKQAHEVLRELRALVEGDDGLAEQWLYTVVFYQGVTALRIGENDNCVRCRGESACILPIAPAAVHTNPTGSRLAIGHFTEYLQRFPDDLGVRWLLNLAHMTLGQYPRQVDPRFLIPLDRFRSSEFDIGKFRDVSDAAGLARSNWAGGAIMEDFDNDGLLDLVVTASDPTQAMAFFHNNGDGTFQDRTEAAGLAGQLGGLSCVQCDYDNDGRMDIFIPRGGWLRVPMPPSLLRNNGDGTFTDVTREAGLSYPVNSNCGAWADYDNDGFLDLFVCCETGPNRLYRNRGDGTFEEVAARAGLSGGGRLCKGCAWIDYDNDGYPDLFLNNFEGPAQLFHNNGDGTFTDVTREMGIDGPEKGFSCWAWDYDNDGWPDLFATSFDRTLDDVVRGLQGQPHGGASNRLFHNEGGKGFKDVTGEAGLDMVFSAMGSNFGDFDNDGFLDMYLGTGDPDLFMLVPNRMFRNVAGRRFAEITGSAGTGHLQKGHGVACGDWRRTGAIDIFVETGGTVPGDRYHNVLFRNPGQGNHWLTVKLVGKKTNRAAVGARIKAVTAGEEPLTVYRHVSSGGSFGANPLQQTIGLGKAGRVARLEIHWPTSGTTQVFEDVDVNQAIEVTEFAAEYRKLDWKLVPEAK